MVRLFTGHVDAWFFQYPWVSVQPTNGTSVGSGVDPGGGVMPGTGMAVGPEPAGGCMPPLPPPMTLPVIDPSPFAAAMRESRASAGVAGVNASAPPISAITNTMAEAAATRTRLM